MYIDGELRKKSIEEQYITFKGNYDVSLGDVYCFLFDFIDEVNSEKRILAKKKKINQFKYGLAKRLGGLLEINGLARMYAYEREKAFLDWEEDITSGYFNQLTSLFAYLNVDSASEVNKLAHFIRKKYYTNMDYVEERRESFMELAIRGVTEEKKFHTEDSELVEAFFQEKVIQLTEVNSKKLVK